MEFTDPGKFNQLSISLQDLENVRIENVSMFSNKYVVQVKVFNLGLTNIA